MSEDINISKRAINYDIKMGYHSDLMCENYDAEIHAVQNSDGRITAMPKNNLGGGFIFVNSDPDRVIAIARMILAFAEMVKNENKKVIDISSKA